MNEWERELMQGPTVKQGLCVFCGKPATEQHHVVYRSRGGTDGPTISVCGFGNADGCHGKLHDGRLHVRPANGSWEFAAFTRPTKVDKVRANWDSLLWLPIYVEGEVWNGWF